MTARDVVQATKAAGPPPAEAWVAEHQAEAWRRTVQDRAWVREFAVRLRLPWPTHLSMLRPGVFERAERAVSIAPDPPHGVEVKVDGETRSWCSSDAVDTVVRELRAEVVAAEIGLDPYLRKMVEAWFTVIDDHDDARGIPLRPWRQVFLSALRHAVDGTRPPEAPDLDDNECPF